MYAYGGILAGANVRLVAESTLAIIIGLVVILVLLTVGFALLGMMFKLMWYFVIGLVIGGLAKALLPGRQELGWIATSLSGIAGSMVGGMLAHRILHVGWLGSAILSVLCAAGLIAVLSGQKRLL